MSINTDNQTVLLVDNNDKFLEYAPREECHTGKGKKHRAFVTLIFDKNNQVLLQKRKHRLFDGLWDFTAISHPLRVNGNSETYQQASDRALRKEMGISHVPIKKIGGFNYFAKDGENCENEYCAVLTGNFNGFFKANKKEVYGTKLVNFADFVAGVKSNPLKYTPWAIKACKILKKYNLAVI